MRMLKIDSTAVSKAGYDKRRQLLAIEYVSGTTYLYRNVPEAIVDALVTAPSFGRYLAQNIIPFPDKYPFTKIKWEDLP